MGTLFQGMGMGMARTGQAGQGHLYTEKISQSCSKQAWRQRLKCEEFLDLWGTVRNDATEVARG
jgi:hypothetical protein